MAHVEQAVFCNQIKLKFPTYFKNKSVLEVGSLNINGTVRDLFETKDYVGVDLFPGKCVDLVGHLVDLNKDNCTEVYDVVCSTEAFEHDRRWSESFKTMCELLKPGGLMFFTCAGIGRAEHGTPKCSPDNSGTGMLGDDYYKNLTIKDFTNILDFDSYFLIYGFEINKIHRDIYGFGIKQPKHI